MRKWRALDKVFVSVGVICVASGIVCNPWLVKPLFIARGVPDVGINKPILAFEAVCIMVGVLLLRYRSRVFRWFPLLLFGTAARRQRFFKFVSILTPFILAEFIIRWAGCLSTYSERNCRRYVSYYDHINTAPWILDSGVNKRYTFGRPEFNYEVRTNSEGVRDIEHPIQKATDEYRIVGLGDSFTMGFGAEYEDSYLKVLERRLRRPGSSKRVTVISGGVAGSDPVYSYYLFVKRLRKYHPDLVMLLLDSSDIYDIMTRGGMDRFGPDGFLRKNDAPKVEWFFAHSHLVRAVMISVLRYDYYLVGPKDRPERVRATLPVLLEVARSLKTLGDEDGFEVLFALRPFSFTFLDESVPGYLSALEKGLSDIGIVFVDLTGAFQAHMGGRPINEFLWPTDLHYNAKGYELLALAFEDALCKHFQGPRFPWNGRPTH